MKSDNLHRDLISPTKENENKSVNLLRNFIIIMFTGLIIASFLLATTSRSILVDNLIASEERNNVAITQILSHSVWPHFKDFINEADTLTGDQIRSRIETTLLNIYINNNIKGLGVVKIKIYNIDGYTIFSSELKQIGSSKKENVTFQKVVRGEVVSKLSFRDKIYAKKEFIENRNIISTYVPVTIGDDTKIQGVFEVYKDVTKIITQSKSTQVEIFASVFSVLTLLFIVLFIVIRNADKVIKTYDLLQAEKADKIRDIAFYDNLTGLPNRVLFLDRLEHSLQVAARNNKLVVLMFIDLDRFKQINDNLGHEMGDKLLIEVAERLHSCVRTCDTTSRISGDEFTVLVESINIVETATSIAHRIVSKIAQPFILNNTEVFITCSIGLSIYPFSDDNAGALIKKADAAMFYSKSCGRNNFHYFIPTMLEHGSQRFELESDLNSAIANSELFLQFQPKITLANYTMHGMEALVRWEHPRLGTISPDVFIPILEETGLIIKVGEWVLRESCRLTKQWNDQGNGTLCVAVNVSALQLSQPNFVDIVESILTDTKLPPEYLELELTESCLMENIDDNIDIIRELKTKGILLSIDDFGTGYSSLSYLCKLPINTLKIDKSFISDMLINTNKRSIVNAIISFGHSLNLNVVAEGIETLEQLQFIQGMRCTAAQGYLLSKPLSVDDFTALTLTNRKFENL